MSQFCALNCDVDGPIGSDGVACAGPGCLATCHAECAEASCRVDGWIFRRWVCPDCLDKQTSVSHPAKSRHACQHKNKLNHSCDCLQNSSSVSSLPRSRHSIADPNVLRFESNLSNFDANQGPRLVESDAVIDCNSPSCYCSCSCKFSSQDEDVVSKTVASNLSDDVKLVGYERNGSYLAGKLDEIGYEEFREDLTIFEKILGKIKNSIRCTSTPSRVHYEKCVRFVHFDGASDDPAGVSGYDERREPIVECGEPQEPHRAAAAQRLSRYSVEHPLPVHFGALSISEGLRAAAETKELPGNYWDVAAKRASGVYRAELVRLVDEGVLVQEVDEGQPCLACEKCQGFELHHWRWV